MLTLYTAVGYLKITYHTDGTPYPVIINNGREHSLSEHEMAIWSSLAFQILQIHELEARYVTYKESMKHPDAVTFAHSLNRLLLRELITTGTGLTGIDALYQLLGELYIHPVKDTPVIRLFSSIRLFLSGKPQLPDFNHTLKKEKHNALEKTILKLSDKVSLSTAELLSCMELGIADTAKLPKTLDNMYDNDSATCRTVAEEAQIHHLQLPVLQAIGNLYLQKQILFQKF